MKIIQSIKSVLVTRLGVCALLGVMVASQAMALDIRYQSSGDYLNAAGWVGGVIPGSLDTARFNWGNNTVTLAGEAPLLRRFQMGVDESGGLEVNSGGKLITTGGANSTVGNNPNVGIIGRLTVNAGGEVTVTNVLFVGGSATGIVTNNGGTVLVTSHLWVGSGAVGVGSIYITNGGVFTVRGNIGLGTVNASTPSGGKGSIYVQDGGVLKLNQITAVNSIQPLSVLDVSGSGVVIITNNSATAITNYVTAGRITSYGGAGTVGIDYNNTNVNQTTIFAIAPVAPPPTNSIWTATSGAGTWNQGANWSSGVAPFSVTKANFNVVGAIPCTVTNAAVADYVVMGENGPGGTLNVTNGGTLSCGAVSASVIGYNSNALMVVSSGGTVGFGYQLWVGLNPGSDGTLIMNGGTVSVANMFGLGWNGGKGTAQINGGTLSLSQWDDTLSIQGASVMNITGSGIVVINGDHQSSAINYIASGQITNSAGTLVVNYNTLYAGKTTIYPAGLYIPPTLTTWDPSLNSPDVEGLWNNSTNWTGGFGPTNVTLVRFNVPGAIPCIVTNAAVAQMVRMGINGGPGGTLIITNGGSLTTTAPAEWCGVGYDNTAELIVESGGSASIGEHLWIGFNPTGTGTFTMNGGTVAVTGMFGLGWNGGTGTALINGGTLNLNQWHATDSIKTATSLLSVSGTGKVVITGDQTLSVSNYIVAGKITGSPSVYYSYNGITGKTTISTNLVTSPPSQMVTGVTVSGTNASLTYQTTAGHSYVIQQTPSLSPTSWVNVPGSAVTNATGASVIFPCPMPAGTNSMFYRTLSY